MDTLNAGSKRLNRENVQASAGMSHLQSPREIESTDRQIDQLVYELYGLTKDEIATVEEATASKPS
jgi:hypothetical protein